jgi:hypothetical protein
MLIPYVVVVVEASKNLSYWLANIFEKRNLYSSSSVNEKRLLLLP